MVGQGGAGRVGARTRATITSKRADSCLALAFARPGIDYEHEDDYVIELVPIVLWRFGGWVEIQGFGDAGRQVL